MGLGITGMVPGRREVCEESSTGSLSTFVGCSLVSSMVYGYM